MPYYEREGLLPQAQRLASGYRTYHASELQRLQFVRRAKALGFTLPEIRERLALSQQAEEDMATRKRRLRRSSALWMKASPSFFVP